MLREITDKLRLGTITKTVTTIDFKPEEAQLILNFVKLGDAAACRVSALQEAGLHEVADCARVVSRSLP